MLYKSDIMRMDWKGENFDVREMQIACEMEIHGTNLSR